VTNTPLHLRLPPETASVTALLDALEAYTEAQALPIKLASRLMLVADELAANVVMHATGASFFQAEVEREGEVMRFILTDDGPEFDPLGRGAPNTHASVEEREVGGLGVHFVERLAAKAAYRREDGRNILTITLDARAD
jgi:serine/threonine-protein kinase RsbW